MKVNVTFRHMDPDDELRDYVEEKVSRLGEKYMHRPQDATVVFTAEKFRRVVEISLKGDNTVLKGREVKEDAKSAIDLALDKLEIQGRKYRDKYKPRKRGSSDAGTFSVSHTVPEKVGDEDFEPRVIPDDKFLPKPLTVDDAVMVLEETKDDFLIFRNSDTQDLCVLYRRPDGHFGLVEPGA